MAQPKALSENARSSLRQVGAIHESPLLMVNVSNHERIEAGFHAGVAKPCFVRNSQVNHEPGS